MRITYIMSGELVSTLSRDFGRMKIMIQYGLYYLRKNRKLRQLSHSYTTGNAMRTLYSSYQLWRKKFLFEKNMVFMYAKALIEVKNQILVSLCEIWCEILGKILWNFEEKVEHQEESSIKNSRKKTFSKTICLKCLGIIIKEEESS